MAQPVPLGAQRLLLVLARPGGLDLVELEREQVELSIARPGQLLELRDALAQVTHLLVRGADALAELELRGAAVAVEDVELRRRDHQLSVLVLPVEREQAAAELAQVARRSRSGRRCTRGCGRRATRAGRARAPRRPRGIRSSSVRLEPRRAREHAFDVRLGRAGADDAAARAAAQQQIERVRQQRLAGAGLPGEDVQSGARAGARRAPSASRFSTRSS